MRSRAIASIMTRPNGSGQSMGNSSADRFEERFTAGRMAADYVSHYQSVVNGGSAEYRRQRLPADEESATPS
jgi:hypothetical protein